MPKKSNETIETKLERKTARIGVVGLGYVGLPLAVEYAQHGFVAIGIDVDKNKIVALQQGKNYIADIDDEVVRTLVSKKRLIPTNTFDKVASLDAIFICVPTPFTPSKEPDISYIISAAEKIGSEMRKGQVIILKSTTFPSTTQSYVLPILERLSKLKVGKDFSLAFSPERIDPGNKQWKTSNIPNVVGGVTPSCTKAAAAVIGQVVAHVKTVSSPAVAEMEKLLENIFRSVNIALVNELAQLCDRIGGINVWEVVEAAASKPFGFMPFYPGPGIGGHCILIDPYYLEWYARAFDFHTNFIALAAEVNESMPFYVLNMVLKELSRLGKKFTNAKVLFLGVAFKRDVNDTRHSPALKVMELLLNAGIVNVAYNDPFVPEIDVCDKKYNSVGLSPKMLKNADIVVITTDHSTYDYKMIARTAKCIVDTRNALKGENIDNAKTVVRVLGSGA